MEKQKTEYCEGVRTLACWFLFDGIWGWLKRDTTATDWFIVILTAVIAGTSYFQWQEIKAGSTDTHALAVAAQTQATTMQSELTEMHKQTDINRQQLIGSQAAVLDMGIAFNDGSGEFNVELTNSGHVTATEIHLKVEASKQKLKDGTLIGQAYKFEPTIPPIQGQKGGPNWIWKSPYGMTERERQMPGGKWPPGWPGEKTYVFRVTLSYQNGFGEESKEEVCQQTLPAWSIVWSKDRMSSGGGLYECRDINATIDSIVEQHRKAEQAAAKPN